MVTQVTGIVIGDFGSIFQLWQFRQFFSKFLFNQKYENIFDFIFVLIKFFPHSRINLCQSRVARSTRSNNIVVFILLKNSQILFRQRFNGLCRPGRNRRQTTAHLVFGDNNRNTDKFQRLKQGFPRFGVHKINPAASKEKDSRFVSISRNNVRTALTEWFCRQGWQGPIRTDEWCREAQPQPTLVWNFLEQ